MDFNSLFEAVKVHLDNNYIHGILIILVSLILAKIVLSLFKLYIDKHVKKTETKENNKIIMHIEHPIVVLIILVGAQLALNKISPSNLTYDNILKTIMIMVITYMFVEISNSVLVLWQKQHQRDNLAFHEEVLPLMKSLIKLILVLTALVIVLQVWGVAVGALLTSLGIIGIVLGFAFKDTLSNIFGGISLIIDDSLHKKDVIELLTGEKGEVVEINLRSTKIKTFDNNFLIIPNGLLTTTKFYNYAAPTRIYRIKIDFSVAYGSDIEQVKEVAIGTLKGRTDILKFPKRSVRFEKMSDFSLDFKLLFYIPDYKDMFDMKDIMTTDLYNNLVENGINIPFPTRTIYNETVSKKRKKVVNKNNSKKIKTLKKKVVKKIKKK